MSDERTVPHRIEGQPIRGLGVEVLAGPDTGKRFVASTEVMTIGSAPNSDLTLSDETVSRYHLELRRTLDRIEVEDCGSTNGTFVGPVQIHRATITPGTVVNVGRSQLRVVDAGTVTLDWHSSDALGRLRGRSPAMRQLMARIKKAAASDISIVLLGETGTGKEVIAHAIHDASPRKKGPFETVDCGALLPTLIASELFGHEKGAFTGADRQYIGAFERADGGTLFLDEIGELPTVLQAALLGALERRRFRRVGGSAEISVDVRVLSATHRDLRAEVNRGVFRQDLYFRLAVLLLRIPPLRERIDDLPVLIEHFLREGGYEGPVQSLIPTSMMLQLEAHHWPGNVRELRNLVEATQAMGEAPSLTETLAETGAEPAPGGPEAVDDGLYELSYKDARSAALNSFEQRYFRRLLDRAKGNVAQAARLAQMDRSYLFQVLKRHGLRDE